MRSASNLDLLAGRDLDLVICLNPTSTLGASPGPASLDRVGGRHARRVGQAARPRGQAACAQSGTEVVLIQPVADDLGVMGAT